MAGGPPRLWSAEDPALYILVISLITPEGQTLECESCQVRFAREEQFSSFMLFGIEIPGGKLSCLSLCCMPGWVPEVGDQGPAAATQRETHSGELQAEFLTFSCFLLPSNLQCLPFPLLACTEAVLGTQFAKSLRGCQKSIFF